jgi:hypothetical protein
MSAMVTLIKSVLFFFSQSKLRQTGENAIINSGFSLTKMTSYPSIFGLRTKSLTLYGYMFEYHSIFYRSLPTHTNVSLYYVKSLPHSEWNQDKKKPKGQSSQNSWLLFRLLNSISQRANICLIDSIASTFYTPSHPLLELRDHVFSWGFGYFNLSRKRNCRPSKSHRQTSG